MTSELAEQAAKVEARNRRQAGERRRHKRR